MSVRLPKRGPVPNPRAALLATVSETEFQNAVIAWAKRGGWLVSAMRDSRQLWWETNRGIPDLVLAKEGRIIFAELKKERGYVTRDQALWLATLRTCPGVEVYVWHPHDEDDIKEVLGA